MNSYWELTVRDTCPEGVLNALWEAGIPFFGARVTDPVTVVFRVAYKDAEPAERLLLSRGCEVLSRQAYGLRPGWGRMKQRYALLVCGAVCALVLAVSNLFVWRIDVTGNETVPTGAVLRAMDAAGAGIGSFWPGFDGEALRTELLVQLPQLQWAGVSYHSGVVQVAVREQREPPTVVDNDAPTHIVSKADGIITHISAKLGQTAATVGDTVQKGQLLISGAAQSPMGTTRPVHALGAVQARTWRALTVRQPATMMEKAYSGKKTTKISVIFRGKPLNFYIGSSFSGGTCDKIILDYHLCMDGVFSLPVEIVVQRCVYRDARQRQLTPERQEELARDALMETLEQLVGEGEIVKTDMTCTARTQGMTAALMAECLEEIGEEVPMTDEELRQIHIENTSGDETTND